MGLLLKYISSIAHANVTLDGMPIAMVIDVVHWNYLVLRGSDGPVIYWDRIKQSIDRLLLKINLYRDINNSTSKDLLPTDCTSSIAWKVLGYILNPLTLRNQLSGYIAICIMDISLSFTINRLSKAIS